MLDCAIEATKGHGVAQGLRYTRVGTTMVLVHDERDPTDEDWAEYVEVYREGAFEHGVSKLLVISAGGGPNARQRRAVLTALAGKEGTIRTAICSSSAMARGITTAIGWMTPAQLRSFGYEDRHAALDYLEVPAAKHADILQKVRALIDDLRDHR